VNDSSPLIKAQLTFAEAIKQIPTPGKETVALENALHRICACDILAAMDSPPYPRAIVEGFLVNIADTLKASEKNPINFSIGPTVNPGDTTCPLPKVGSSVQTVTGAIVPQGDYAIVRPWDATIKADTFEITRAFSPGFFIESQACEHSQGEVLLKKGQRISPENIGLLASQGISEIEVCKKPEVSVFASGDEVIPHTQAFQAGKIYDCNSIMLSAEIQRIGGSPFTAGIQGDNFDSFKSALADACKRSQLILIAGGTAIGGRDFISDMIRELGELIIDGVQMKSGRPLIMGLIGNTPVVGVAGHPPEALRGFRLFAPIAMDILCGREVALPQDPGQISL